MLTEKQLKLLEETNLPLYLLLETEAINSDDEPDASVDQEVQAEEGQEQEPPQVDENGEPVGPPPSEEDVFAAELEGTEDKFLQFVLYDKLTDLASKIKILQDNIKNDASTETLEILSKLDHYGQYLEVLNELIFSISTSVVYKILGQIELELIDILQVYNSILEQKQEKEKLE